MVLVRAILNGFFMFPPNLEVVGGSGYVDFDRYHLLWECGEKFFVVSVLATIYATLDVEEYFFCVFSI